jgi:hypothetical protein
MPASPKQAKAVELVREAIWCFYRSLKLWKQSPCPGAEGHSGGSSTGSLASARGTRTSMSCWPAGAAQGRTAAGARAPEIPLHTNASENDLRACVIKRKISGGTMSANGRLARDVMLGPAEDLPQARAVVLHLSRGSAGTEWRSTEDPATRQPCCSSNLRLIAPQSAPLTMQGIRWQPWRIVFGGYGSTLALSRSAGTMILLLPREKS